jgi:asparagine synthase (glutamine-hydrolysing)
VPAETLQRPKSAYPGTHDPEYGRQIMRSLDAVLDDRTSPLFGLLDVDRVRALQRGDGRTMTWLNTAHLLLPLVEVDRWMRDYRVTLA